MGEFYLLINLIDYLITGAHYCVGEEAGIGEGTCLAEYHPVYVRSPRYENEVSSIIFHFPLWLPARKVTSCPFLAYLYYYRGPPIIIVYYSETHTLIHCESGFISSNYAGFFDQNPNIPTTHLTS